MSNIAIIPARAGSKRIPDKNIFPILGKPAIAYAISTAFNSGLFSNIFVSTDSPEIARISESYGATVGRLRDSDLSGDHSTTIEVISGFINSELKPQTYPNYICCIYQVTPLLTPERLQEGFSSVIQNSGSFILAAVPAISHPYRSFQINNQLEPIFENSSYTETRTQDLGHYFQDAGQFYWASTSLWLSQESILGANCKAIRLNKYEVIDVDDIEDMKLVEILLKAKKI